MSEASLSQHIEVEQSPVEMMKEHESSPTLESSNQDHSDLGPVGRDVQDSTDQVLGMSIDHDQHAPDEAYSPPSGNIEAQHTDEQHEGVPTYIEEKELDPTSETTAIDASHNLQEHELIEAHGNPEDAAFHPDSSGAAQPKSTTLTDAPLLHLERPKVETAESHDLQNDQDDSFRERADLTHDILDDYASNDSALQDDQNEHSHENSRAEPWPLPCGTPSQDAEMAHNELPNERPATPSIVSNTFDFAPTTPRHLIQESHSGLAESPATVLDADDLFADDDDEDKEGQEQVDDYGDGEEVEHDASQENTAWNPEQTHGTSPAHHHEDNHSVSEYSSATPGERYNPVLEDAVPYPPQEPDAGLHIRTRTADTIPSFESYAQSDDASTPTSPSETASSPFMEHPHGKTTVLCKVPIPSKHARN